MNNAVKGSDYQINQPTSCS